MNKIYIIAGFVLVVLGAYWSGAKIASEKCQADFTQQENTNTQNMINIKGKINAETYNTATVDIRNSLRNKYTIQD
jgi:hypothetical protein